MRINVAIPENQVSKPILDASLEAVTRLNQSLLRDGVVPHFREALKSRGIRWRPEPPGDEHFDHAEKVMSRNWGDCDDLAPWLAASHRHTGRDPGAQAIVKKSGHKRWHAVVQRSDGTIEDPSKEAGMGSGVHGVAGACVSPIGCVGVVGSYVNLPNLSVRPLKKNGRFEAWQAQAELPWHYATGNSPTDIAMASLHRSPVASQAVVGAIQGAIALGQSGKWCDAQCLEFLEALHDVHHGADWHDIADTYGEDMADSVESVVGAVWSSVGKFSLKKLVPKPLRKTAEKVLDSKAISQIAPFIPGGGQAYMLAKGAQGALNRGGNVFDMAKGFGGGAAGAGANYLDSGIVKAATNIIPGGKQFIPLAKGAARGAEAMLSDAPPMAIDSGAVPEMATRGSDGQRGILVPVSAKKRRARRSSGGGGKPVREIIIRNW